MSDDWNNDDFWRGYHVGSSDSCDNLGPGYQGSSSSLFKIVLYIIITIIVLAVLLGVAITAPVVEFLLKILLLAGMITLLFK